MSARFLGIDVGTTGSKACFYDGELRLLSCGYAAYATEHRPDGAAEQNADDWVASAADAVRQAAHGLDLSGVTALGLSTQGGSTVPVGEDLRPLCPALTWMDKRASRESEELCAALGREEVLRRTGWAPGPAFDPAKLRFLRRTAPCTFAAAHYFLSTAEYVGLALTGELAVDPTNAALRQLIDVAAGAWDDGLLAFCDLTPDRLPPILPAGAPLGTLTATAAGRFGLPASTTVYVAAHDQYCAALGAGAVAPGDLLLATGTAWVTFGVTERPLAGEIASAPHPAGNWGNLVSFGGGSALKWLRDLTGTDYPALDRGAADCRERAAELLVHPYFNGAGFPHGVPSASAAITGLRAFHTKFDLALAIMEGVAFEAKAALSAFSERGFPDSGALTVTGGAAASPLWLSVLSAILDRPVCRLLSPQPCCGGAAALAAAGEGAFPLREASSRLADRTPPASPDPDAVAFYREKHRRYLAAGD